MKAWTRSAALDALKQEAARLGRTPRAIDLWSPTREGPSCKVYQRIFGSLTAAQRAAELTPTRRGAVPGWRKAVCHRGHKRTADNVGTKGHCRKCMLEWSGRRKRVSIAPATTTEIGDVKNYWLQNDPTLRSA